jgi:hypothetical protein
LDGHPATAGLRLLSKVLPPQWRGDLAAEDKRDGEQSYQPPALLAQLQLYVWGLLSGSPLLPPVQIRGEKLRKPCAP